MAISTTGRDTIGESPTSPEPDGVLADTYPLLTKEMVISGDGQAFCEQGQETAMDGEDPNYSDPVETPSAKTVGDMRGTSLFITTPGGAQKNMCRKTGHNRGKRTCTAQTFPEVSTKWAGRLRRPRQGWPRKGTQQQGEM